MLKKIVLPVVGLLLVLSIAFGASAVFASSASDLNPVGLRSEDPPPDEWLDANYPDWFVIAAESMNLDEDALWLAVEEGKNIADLAKDQGISTQQIIDAIIVAEKDFTKELVSNGSFTQEEADEWLAMLPEEAKSFVEESWDFEVLEGGSDWFTIAAETMKLDEEALWDALDNGQTLADVAKAQGVAQETVVDAIVVAEQTFINELVASGDLSQEEADEWATELREDAESFLTESWDWEEFEGVDWFGIVIETLNMDEDALWDALDNGQSLADVAKAQGIAQETVVDAIVTAEQTFIVKLVSEGEFTQEEADEWLAELDEEAKYFLSEEGADFDVFVVDWLTITSEALNMDEDALWEALSSGQSVADLAKAQGVDQEVIVNTILLAEKDFTAKLLADSTITQEEADERNGMLLEEIQTFIDESFVWDVEAE